MNANPIGWVCLTMAIGCLFVAIIALTMYVLPASDPPPWSRTLAARSFMASIAFIGISIPMWIEPAAAARFEFWVLHSQRPITGPALGCFILAVMSIGIAVGASIAGVFSKSIWIGRWQTAARSARRAAVMFLVLHVVVWNLAS
ncbi:hypothetical protein [Herpetosiphon gulosus]|uniref:Uncharacterized protein n=1 Tax=Herpetosiphon gulosus TaxID=1973496 RepID=A0ABP9X6K8_9CHLR